MATFPEFIIPMSGGPLQARPLQVPQMNIAPLMQSLRKPQRTKGGGSKSGTKDDLEVKGLKGAVDQFWGNLNEIRSEQTNMQSIYGEDAVLSPRYQALQRKYEQYSSPDVINTIDRRTKEMDQYREHTKGKGDLFNLELVMGTNGLKTFTNSDAIHYQENAEHKTIPNELGHGYLSTNGVIRPANSYMENLPLSPTLYDMKDAQIYIDKIMEQGDNQFFEKAGEMVKNAYKGSVSGIGKYGSSYANDFMTLSESQQQLMQELGLPIPVVKRDALGNPIVKQDKRGMPAHDQNNRIIYEYETYTDKDGKKRIKYEGDIETVDLTSPMGAGLMQGWLRKSKGGVQYKGKLLREAYDIYDEEGNVIKKKGEFSQDFWEGFGDWTKNLLTKEYTSRANEKKANTEAFTQLNQGQKSGYDNAMSLERVLRSRKQRPTISTMYADPGAMPVSETHQNRMKDYYSLFGLGDPLTGDYAVFQSTFGPGGQEYAVMNPDFNLDVVNDKIDKYVANVFTGKNKMLMFEMPSGAFIPKEAFKGEDGEWRLPPEGSERYKMNQKEYADKLKKQMKEYYLMANSKAVNDVLGFANHVEFTFDNATAAKKTLEDMFFRKGQQSSQQALAALQNTAIEVSPGTKSAAEQWLSNDVRVKSIGSTMILGTMPQATNWFYGKWKGADGKDHEGFNFFDATKKELTPSNAPDFSLTNRGENGGILYSFSEDSYEAMRKYSQAAVENNDVNATQTSPVGYWMDFQMEVDEANLGKLLNDRKWLGGKVYTDHKDVDPTLKKEEKERIEKLLKPILKVTKYDERRVKFKKDGEWGELDVEPDVELAPYNNALTFQDDIYYQEAAKLNFSRDEADKLRELIVENGGDFGKTTTDFIVNMYENMDASPEDVLTTAQSVDSFSNKEITPQEFVSRIKAGTLSEIMPEHQAAMMNFSYDDATKKITYNIRANVNTLLDKSPLFATNKNLRNLLIQNQQQVQNEYGEQQKHDIDANLRNPNLERLINLSGF